METTVSTEIFEKQFKELSSSIKSFEGFAYDCKNILKITSELIVSYGDEINELPDREKSIELLNIAEKLYGLCSLINMINNTLDIEQFSKIDNVLKQYNKLNNSDLHIYLKVNNELKTAI